MAGKSAKKDRNDQKGGRDTNVDRMTVLILRADAAFYKVKTGRQYTCHSAYGQGLRKIADPEIAVDLS